MTSRPNELPGGLEKSSDTVALVIAAVLPPAVAAEKPTGLAQPRLARADPASHSPSQPCECPNGVRTRPGDQGHDLPASTDDLPTGSSSRLTLRARPGSSLLSPPSQASKQTGKQLASGGNIVVGPRAGLQSVKHPLAPQSRPNLRHAVKLCCIGWGARSC